MDYTTGRRTALGGNLKRAVSRWVARTTEALFPQPAVARLRASRDWKPWVNSLTPELLDELTGAPATLKRQMFKANVFRVEIETHAKCNRICSFCPNVMADRRRNNTLAEASLLDRVFDELGSIDYQKQICVARYSEPLASRENLYERIASARSRVPHAELAITTNTDYLTPAVLVRLREVGLNVVYMSLYLRDREEWSLELAHAYSNRLARKLRTRILNRQESSTSMLCVYKYKGLALRSTCHNWKQYGTDRGGMMEIYSRQRRIGPCRDPFESFVIDYNGSVMPCCNLRSDLPQHREFVVGDLSVPGVSIFDIYAGRLATWRRGLVAFGSQSFPCATCRHRDLPRELVVPIAALLERKLQETGCSAHYHPPSGMRVVGMPQTR